MSKTQQCLAGAAFLALLGFTLAVYWPGLYGPLTLDDIPNLKRLDVLGPIDDVSSLLQFVFYKSGSYPARPLSYASFLINDVGWPLYVPMHKYTNVLIHLLNGALVFWLALLLCRPTGVKYRVSAVVALTATALWLLAPLQVSTVLYVIQRMAQLSTLFILGGLIMYCYGRFRLETRPVSGFLQMTAGVVVFGIVGFLFKQNAILLTLYILVIEYTLFRHYIPVSDKKIKHYFLIWQWLILVAPLIITFIVLFSRGTFAFYDKRPFTMLERLLTQPRILFDYLQSLLIPVRQGMGVTHDDYLKSTGLFCPPATAVSVFALICAVVAAFLLARRKASLFGFAVLWFLAGHVLESTILPLELYFEHRNYLPSFGPLFAISFAVWTTRIRVYRFLRIGLAVYLLAFVVVTKQNVDIWSSKAMMAEFWAAEHPRSVRAQQIRADFWSRLGHFDKASETLKRITELRPESMGAQIQLLLTTCRHEPDVVPTVYSNVLQRIPATHFDHSVGPTFQILKDINEDICPQLTDDDLLRLIDAVLENESIDRRRSDAAVLLALKASILSETASAQAVVSHLYAAFQRHRTQSVGLLAVDYLYRIGHYRVALQVLEEVEEIEVQPWSLERFSADQLKKWREKITKRLEDAG